MDVPYQATAQDWHELVGAGHVVREVFAGETPTITHVLDELEAARQAAPEGLLLATAIAAVAVPVIADRAVRPKRIDRQAQVRELAEEVVRRADAALVICDEKDDGKRLNNCRPRGSVLQALHTARRGAPAAHPVARLGGVPAEQIDGWARERRAPLHACRVCGGWGGRRPKLQEMRWYRHERQYQHDDLERERPLTDE